MLVLVGGLQIKYVIINDIKKLSLTDKRCNMPSLLYLLLEKMMRFLENKEITQVSGGGIFMAALAAPLCLTNSVTGPVFSAVIGLPFVLLEPSIFSEYVDFVSRPIKASAYVLEQAYNY